jgi:hypothetical protein
MNATEFDEMVGLMETWWGPEACSVWQADTWPLLAELPTETIYEALTDLRDGGRHPDFPPKPPALRAEVIDRMRHRRTERPALPETTEAYTWAEYSMRVYGEKISLDEAVRIAGKAHSLGLPAPSPDHPWRRPEETEEDRPESAEQDRPDPIPAEVDDGPQSGRYGPIRDVEPPEDVL